MAVRSTFDLELDALGEGEVRKKLAQGVWNEGKTATANAWLEAQIIKRSVVDAADAKAHMVRMETITRRATWAAWLGAGAAAISAISALIAILKASGSS